MNALAARRRHPAAIAILLLLGLVVTGGVYALVAPRPAQAAVGRPRTTSAPARSSSWPTAPPATASTPRAAAAGPSLVGVGAASVDFQVGTGRMPLANPGVQAHAQARTSSPTSRSSSSPRTSRRWAPARPSRTRPVHLGRGRRHRQGRRALPHQLRHVPQLRRLRRRPDPRQVRAEPAQRDAARTSTRRWSPARSRCRCSATPTSRPRTSGTSSPTCTTSTRTTNPGGLTLGNLGPVSEGLFAWIFGIGAPHRLRRLARQEGRVTMTRPSPSPGARLHHCETTGFLTR